MNQPHLRRGHHSHSATQWPVGGGASSLKYDTHVQRPLRSCVQRPEHIPGPSPPSAVWWLFLMLSLRVRAPASFVSSTLTLWGDMAICGFLIWFWKHSMSGYISHILRPLLPNKPICKGGTVFAWPTLMLQLGYLNHLKEEESFDFMARKNPDMKAPVYVKKTTVESRCHLKNHLKVR